MNDLHQLPDNLPIPIDDGVCDHLTGLSLPSVELQSVSGSVVHLSRVPGILVVFFYPMNGRPDALPMIGWNEIPGARGCTPQVCAFRDSYAKLKAMNVKVFGVSAQSLVDQQEASTRLSIDYPLLNDSQFELCRALRLPTFEYQSATYIKRITLIVENGVIKKHFYPVFPPDKNVVQVIDWIKQDQSC